ncbi:hypothetical protein FQ087_20780 [Sporosarcina sp. ANT_H38]|uniref:hypothetical protein n=1 Tax=Sporosarcina sp. ANT_H38 TaxID=2597358 RepID=UPI0011F3B043|nr:hypothetical protein [Sporosarcina sp. ANT_H38]KAA0941595.1 hypothetical protein FQ087_20780 [Sporosarcina sp. ANT_H38]
MDNEWQWQQENIKLKHENKRLRNEFATFKVNQIPEAARKDGKIFTKQELKFIKDNGLSYDRVYGLVYKYQSVEDALIETLEGIL